MTDPLRMRAGRIARQVVEQAKDGVSKAVAIAQVEAILEDGPGKTDAVVLAEALGYHARAKGEPGQSDEPEVVNLTTGEIRQASAAMSDLVIELSNLEIKSSKLLVRIGEKKEAAAKAKAEAKELEKERATVVAAVLDALRDLRTGQSRFSFMAPESPSQGLEVAGDADGGGRRRTRGRAARAASAPSAA